ncbi:MAG: radical SAM family heme chaperone HemW [Propionibacteriaceae bacterium]|nr:radical SAM family heme chaperone HemW [Propionibacteriaceae bacterium]
MAPALTPADQPVPDDGRLPAEALAELGRVPFGVYVHVPFCRTRCGYCDFNTYTASELPGVRYSDYLDAALAEIGLARRVLGGAPGAATLFFGGGTPTLLPPAQLGRLVAAVGEGLGLEPGAEVTTEANPETLDEAVLEALLEAGITRISIGMQSAVGHVLAVLERAHTPGRAVAMARAARRAGFGRVSLDLIYGAPGESADDWQRSLDAVVEAGVDHVSAYSLIVEPGTRMARRVRRGELPMPDEDELADKYLQAEETLTRAGFSNYETSNWALTKASRSRHNLAYWRGFHWWGIGPGAHSHVGGVRWWNRKHPRAYAEALAGGRTPAQGREVLTREERRLERVLLELRLAEGLPIGVLTEAERERIPGLIADGLGVLAGERLVLTLRGRLLADGVVASLLA